jgi:hypothetical protein
MAAPLGSVTVPEMDVICWARIAPADKKKKSTLMRPIPRRNLVIIDLPIVQASAKVALE